jgi:PAS domain S-box-containing protein
MELKKIINNYESNKIKIINSWVSDKEVLKLIQYYNFEQELFIKRYAFGVLDNYIDVVKNNHENYNCPVMLDFIKYLKKFDVSTSHLFLICSAFKNSLVKYAYELNHGTYEIITEINKYFELNFSGVLSSYSKTIKEIEQALNKSMGVVDKYVIMSRTDIQGIITNVSSAFCKISGYTSHELVGQSHNIIRHPDMPKELFENLWETITSGFVWEGEIKNRKKNGDFYWVQTTIHPNFDNMGKIISYDAIRQDISSQKRLEKQHNLLVEQSKSAAMGEMISMIAHQWRQPLQTVGILVQKLPLTKMIEGELTDEVLDEVVNQIILQLDYMSKTIDDFRDYFKPNRKKQKVLIEDIIKKSTDFLSQLFKIDSIEVIVENSVNSYVELHLNEIIQVLINLMKNSRDALVEHNIKNKKIYIKAYDNDDKIFIEVEDNAGGIHEHIIKKIFDPYFSTKTNKNGTGLGLYMSKNIVEQHSNGRLTVFNSDIGARFIIELPRN